MIPLRERDNQAKLIQTYCFTAADLYYNPDQKMTEMDMQWEEEKDRKERANSQGRTTNDDFFFTESLLRSCIPW